MGQKIVSERRDDEDPVPIAVVIGGGPAYRWTTVMVNVAVSLRISSLTLSLLASHGRRGSLMPKGLKLNPILVEAEVDRVHQAAITADEFVPASNRLHPFPRRDSFMCGHQAPSV